MKLKSREKILLVFVFIALAIWGFDLLYYAPQSRKISQIKGEIKAADQKMEQLLLLAKGVETVEAEVARLEKELKGLSERTLKGEEFRAFLRHLARESNALQMKIISLTPQEEKLSPPERKKETDFQYRKITIQMVLHSDYARLGIYLRDIERLPFLVNVDSLQIERSEEILPLLRVTMGLSMHIVTL
ncbi:MAG: type 4a pilus biogenesis protein PilO [Thermodesulfobacteriota bacterium]